jgi:hypothetical protein
LNRAAGRDSAPAILDVAAILGKAWENSEIQRLLLQFSADGKTLHRNEFSSFFLWFGFHRTTSDLILRTIDAPASLLKFILGPISLCAMSQLHTTNVDGWIIALSETPGTFRMFSKTLSRRVVYDALTDEFMVDPSSVRFRSLQEVIDEVSCTPEEIPYDFPSFLLDLKSQRPSFERPFPGLFDRLDPSFE